MQEHLTITARQNCVKQISPGLCSNNLIELKLFWLAEGLNEDIELKTELTRSQYIKTSVFDEFKLDYVQAAVLFNNGLGCDVAR